LFIFATVRENILFGAAFDQARYTAVVQSCALETDITALPGGDQTEIGESSINLSGGQKARISLGRACYSNADTIICGQPTSYRLQQRPERGRAMGAEVGIGGAGRAGRGEKGAAAASADRALFPLCGYYKLNSKQGAAASNIIATA
jgi:hypothetical protein